MARPINRLTEIAIRRAREPGIFEDGGGLRLLVELGADETSISKRWVLRLTINGRRVSRGLGGYPATSLAEARQKAEEHRRAARESRDLAAEGNAARARPGALVTFRDAFGAVLRLREQQLSNAKHLKQWSSTMEAYVFPVIGDKPVADVTASDVIAVIEPIWFDKQETARRVFQRMRAVFDSAIVRGQRALANPCTGVAEELGKRRRAVVHHRAMSWQDVPTFYQQL